MGEMGTSDLQMDADNRPKRISRSARLLLTSRRTPSGAPFLRLDCYPCHSRTPYSCAQRLEGRMEDHLVHAPLQWLPQRTTMASTRGITNLVEKRPNRD